ncbi:hypothetical protein SDC9_137069 [bioreactor metagenome]|uniref:Uncharacterized protein n=1 Tax=bioreactor metagenome TaxID=1076179 RepID=A0A645DKI2_9ZZZZ
MEHRERKRADDHRDAASVHPVFAEDHASEYKLLQNGGQRNQTNHDKQLIRAVYRSVNRVRSVYIRAVEKEISDIFKNRYACEIHQKALDGKRDRVYIFYFKSRRSEKANLPDLTIERRGKEKYEELNDRHRQERICAYAVCKADKRRRKARQYEYDTDIQRRGKRGLYLHGRIVLLSVTRISNLTS